MNRKTLVVGSGAMAREHVKVLSALAVDFDVVGRSEKGCEDFKAACGVQAIPGGIDKFIASTGIADYANFVVATNVTQLYGNVVSLLNAGAKRILVEKPCVLDKEQLANVIALADKREARVFIAYNRRYYASVRRAKEIIEQDGGLQMVKFDFTEWSHIIGGLKKDSLEKERWLLANSTHVIDLAFYFAGTPREISSYVTGKLDWHPSAMVFAGAGMTERDVLFSYGSDWGSAGRWWLELFTPERKLRMCPVEELTETRRGTVAEVKVELENELDTRFKPGLYRQAEAFLSGDDADLKEVRQLAEIFPHFCRIAGYPC